MKTLTGIIHGKTIELSENLGLPDGEEVEIQVTVGQRTRRPGAGLLRCAGAFADHWTDEDDQILAELEEGRLHAAHRELPE